MIVRIISTINSQGSKIKNQQLFHACDGANKGGYHHMVKKMSWFDFAYNVVRNNRYSLFPNNYILHIDFDIIEAKTNTTTVVNASMKITNKDYKNNSNTLTTTIIKTYHGKSTRKLKKTRQPKNEKEIISDEHSLTERKSIVIEGSLRKTHLLRLGLTLAMMSSFSCYSWK